MDLPEIENTLYEVAKVGLPSFIRVGRQPDPVDVAAGTAEEDRPIPLPPREKIEQLESYLLETAEARQRVHEAALYISASLKNLRRDWRDIEGWEQFLSEAERKKPTEVAKDMARRQVNKDLYESIQSAEWLLKELGKQISRLQHDDDVVSRAYTFITGG
jgi:hypothetical protein